MRITDWRGVGIVMAIFAVGAVIAVSVGLPLGAFVGVLAGVIASQVGRRRWQRPR